MFIFSVSLPFTLKRVIFATMSREFTAEEVAKHGTETDCFIVVNDAVLDVTPYLAQHPGGKKVRFTYVYYHFIELLYVIGQRGFVLPCFGEPLFVHQCFSSAQPRAPTVFDLVV
jgi:hypothetical protein